MQLMQPKPPVTVGHYTRPAVTRHNALHGGLIELAATAVSQMRCCAMGTLPLFQAMTGTIGIEVDEILLALWPN